jgi:hypothetical protein
MLAEDDRGGSEHHFYEERAGVGDSSAKRSLNASIVVKHAPGTPIERARPTQSRSARTWSGRTVPISTTASRVIRTRLFFLTRVHPLCRE